MKIWPPPGGGGCRHVASRRTVPPSDDYGHEFAFLEAFYFGDANAPDLSGASSRLPPTLAVSRPADRSPGRGPLTSRPSLPGPDAAL